MGEAKMKPLRLEFNRKLKLEFHGAKVTSDAGLFVYRELDEMLTLTDIAGKNLVDQRKGKNTQHRMTALLRQAVFGRLAGYEDTNDAERLRVDPAMRHVVGGRAEEKTAASTSEMSRFETEFLATEENLKTLSELPGKWIDRVHDRTGMGKLILDMDSS